MDNPTFLWSDNPTDYPISDLHAYYPSDSPGCKITGKSCFLRGHFLHIFWSNGFEIGIGSLDIKNNSDCPLLS